VSPHSAASALQEEAAASIAFLSSDDASYLTGHPLAISDGLSMW
jgi:NAD(P)-dependent dehydrogenase (short-subunit alcohol dehydrogenase family)